MPRAQTRAPEIGGGGGVASEPETGGDKGDTPKGDTPDKSAAGMGTFPSITVTKGTNISEVIVTPIDPTDWGKRKDGTPVNKADVMFWLFYVQDPIYRGTGPFPKNKTKIIAAVDDATVHTTDLEAPDKTKGVIQIAPNTSYPFVITGLKPDTQYVFFLRIIHPDSIINNPDAPKANEGTLHARDTKTDQATSKETRQWHVSTFATGFNRPRGIAVASDGTVYVADVDNNLIKKITPEGDVSIIAGQKQHGHKDHPTTGILAQFNNPRGIALASDALYVVDSGNNRIRKITLSGAFPVITIVSSRSTGYGFLLDNRVAANKFSIPFGIAVTKDDNTLYVVDSGNNLIKKIALPDGMVSIIAGDGIAAHKNNKTGILAQFNNPTGITLAGNALYVADTYNDRIKKITLSGTFPVISFSNFYSLRRPNGIVVASDGTLYVTDSLKSCIKKIIINEYGKDTTSIIAGKESDYGTKDGIGTDAQFNSPNGIAAVSNTLLYVADTANNSIRKLEYKE